MALVDVTYGLSGEMKTVQWTWTADGSGNYSQKTLQVNGVDDFVINGVIYDVEFIPNANAPSNLYDVTLLGTNGIDVLQGYGANLSDTDSKAVKNIKRSVFEALTLVVANAGASNQGSVKIYYR